MSSAVAREQSVSLLAQADQPGEDVGDARATSRRRAARVAAAAAIGLSVLLPVEEFFRFVAFPDLGGNLLGVFVATAVTVPTQVWHVMFGLRGQRPRYGQLSFAMLVL